MLIEQKFKLGDEGRKFLKFTLKELKPVNITSKHDKIHSKAEVIQYAIDNEKILCMMEVVSLI